MKRQFAKLRGIFPFILCSLFCMFPAWANEDVVASVEYFYALDGTLIGKSFNGKRVNFEYDKRGQLLAVKDASGKDLERYTYDPAGNRLSKTINGVTITYTYDKANQLVTSTVNGVTTHYKYDAAGRMIQVGDKKYIYNGQNKVIEVRQNGKTIAKFEYNIDGQIAKAIYGDKVEDFMWDGLALIWRSGVTYINEPYVTGGNPVIAGDDVLFNDMLGSTLAVNGKPVEMTAFGETTDADAFFTGKPMIPELGYSFLFRDYNPAQGKWTTTDPLGYPDGWNQLAYCNNGVISYIDWQGTVSYTVSNIEYTFVRWEYVKTYGAISGHNGNPDGSNITSIIWEIEFNVYRPVYGIKCIDPNCVDYNKNLGTVLGDLFAGVSYNVSGSKNGVFLIEKGKPVQNAPSAEDDLYYLKEKVKDSYPSQIPLGRAYTTHIHKKEE